MTSISKNVYIYKLGNTVNKYNIYHTTIKMKPVDVEYQNIKTFLQKAMFQV